MRKERFIRLILAWGLFFVFTDLSFALDYFEFNNKVNKIPHVYFQNLPISREQIEKEAEKCKEFSEKLKNLKEVIVEKVKWMIEKIKNAIEKIKKYYKERPRDPFKPLPYFISRDDNASKASRNPFGPIYYTSQENR